MRFSNYSTKLTALPNMTFETVDCLLLNLIRFSFTLQTFLLSSLFLNQSIKQPKVCVRRKQTMKSIIKCLQVICLKFSLDVPPPRLAKRHMMSLIFQRNVHVSWSSPPIVKHNLSFWAHHLHDAKTKPKWAS